MFKFNSKEFHLNKEGFKFDLKETYKVYKPLKMAYSEPFKLKFENGVSKKIPIFTNDYYGLVLSGIFPFVNYELLIGKEVVGGEIELETVDLHRPHLMNSDKDVDVIRYSPAKQAFKIGSKTKIPDNLDKGKKDNNINSYCFKVKSIADNYCDMFEEVIDTAELYHPFAQIISNNPEIFKDFDISANIIEKEGLNIFSRLMESIYIKPVVTRKFGAFKDIEEMYKAFLLFPMNFDQLYTIHFELKSDYVVDNNGELVVIIDNVERKELTEWYKLVINKFETTLLTTYINIINKHNTSKKNVWASSTKLIRRKAFADSFDTLVKDGKNGKKSSFSNLLRFLKDLNLNSNLKALLHCGIDMLRFNKGEKLLNLINKFFEFDTVLSKAPIFRRLVNKYIFNGQEEWDWKNIQNLLLNDNDRWMLMEGILDLVDYIEKYSKTTNLLKGTFIFLANHIKYTIPSKEIQEIIINETSKIFDFLTDNYAIIKEEEGGENIVKRVKDEWNKFPVSLECMHVSLLGWGLLKRFISLYEEAMDRYLNVCESKYSEINPYEIGNNPIPENEEKWIRFVKDITNQVQDRITKDLEKAKEEAKENKFV